MSDDGFHEIQLNSKQLIFLCMTAALVLVVAFLSGVLVGRGVRSEKDAGQAADAVIATAAAPVDTPSGAPASAPQQVAPPPAVAPPTPADEDLTYEKRLGGKEPPKETLQPITPPAAAGKAAPKEGTKTAAGKTTPPAKDAAAAKTAVPVDAAKPKADASVLPEPSGSGYYLKIVAYRDRGQAETLAKRLNGKGYNTYIVAATGGLYSVRVGKYKNRKEADSIRRRLEKEEQLKPLISH